MVSYPQVSPPKPCMHLFSSLYVLYPPSISFFLIWCCLLYSPVTSSRLGPNIFLCTLFSNILSLCSTLNVRHQILQPHKTTGKIIVLCILKFIFLVNKLEDKIFCTEWSQNLKIKFWVATHYISVVICELQKGECISRCRVNMWQFKTSPRADNRFI